MMRRSLTILGLTLAFAATAGLPACFTLAPSTPPLRADALPETIVDPSPVDLVLAPDESWLAVLNQKSASVSLLRLPEGRVIAELPVGEHPIDIELADDGQTLLVTCSHSGKLLVLETDGSSLQLIRTIDVGFEPYGVATGPQRHLAYVARAAHADVAVVDLARAEVVATIEVGKWPRYLDVSADGRRLAVGTSGDRGATVVDLERREQLYLDRFMGLNLGHMKVNQDGSHAYFPWMVYRQNPITEGNIRLGWVLASRIGRVRLDERERREAFSLDPRGKAIADPHGLDFTPGEKHLVVSAAGTHELLVYQHAGLPFEAYGSTDHIVPELLADEDRFYRIELGGRPLGLQAAGDGRTVYVANYLSNSVQVVDILERGVAREFTLGGPRQPSAERRGEAIFYDARRSLDQWYSCHSCHYEGGTNSAAMDTLNDNSTFTFKTVLPLYNVHETEPWTWHGWQTDLRAAMRKSITSTMRGAAPSESEIDDLLAYLRTLRPPRNPYRADGDELSEAAVRGRQVFESEQAGCSECHSGPLLTDHAIHDIGLGRPRDRLEGFNTPSLRGVHRKVLLLHDGRATTFAELLEDHHSPEKVSGGKLTAEQRADLIEFLKTL